MNEPFYTYNDIGEPFCDIPYTDWRQEKIAEEFRQANKAKQTKNESQTKGNEKGNQNG